MPDPQTIPQGLQPLLPALLEVARDLNSEKDLDRLLEQTIPRVVCSLTGAERCSIFLVDSEKGELWSRVATGVEQLIRLRIGEGIAGVVAATGESLQIDDPYSDPRFAREIDEATGFRTTSVLCAPLREMNGSIMGVFQVLNKQGGAFTPEDQHVLEILGRQAAVAIQGARLNRALRQTQSELREQVRRMTILHRIEKELNRSEELDATLSAVIRLCAEALDADAGSILLLQDGAARLYFQYAWGEKSDDLRRMSIPQDQGLAGWVLHNRQAAVSNDPASDPRHSAEVSARLGYSVHNLIAAPLLPGGRPLGAIELVNRSGRGFDRNDLQLLDFLANQISGTLDRKLLLENLRQSQRLATVGSMTGRIIHDLKNTMSVIRGLTEMSDRQNVPPEKLQRRKQLMLSAIDSLVAMTQDILDFTRGNLSYKFQPTRLKELFDEVFPLLERECSVHQVTLSVTVPEDLVLEADALKLRRVLFNLASNAVEAMSVGGQLEVVASASAEGSVSIRFLDTGPGIPAALEDRLFSPFATHGKSQGVGLGLAICKTIMEGHGGQIEGHNRPEGGACFTIRLPRAHAWGEQIQGPGTAAV
jgi:signal transduction histidine kinase